jgi:hypothetical protein
MKKLYFLFVFISLSSLTEAQNYEWAYTAGYDNFSFLTSIKRDHNDDIYLSSYRDSSGINLQTRIEKRNSSNAVLWNLDLLNKAVIVDVEINTQNHAVIAGYYSDTLIIGNDTLLSPAMNSTFLIEFFEDGNIFWVRNFNPANDDFKPIDLFIDGSDNLYLTAELGGFSSHGFTSFHKLDLWGFPLMDEFNDNTEVRTFSHIMADNAGNVYLSGTCGNFAMFDSLPSDPNMSYQNFLVKYDANFNALWIVNRSYITFDNNNGLGCDGQFLYWTFLEASSSADILKLVKADLNGQIQIENPGPLANSSFPRVNSSTDSSGNTVLAANVFNRIYLYRYNNLFQLKWEDSLMTQTSGFSNGAPVVAYDSSFYIGSQFYPDSLLLDTILLLNSDPAGFKAEVFYTKWSSGSTVNILNYSKDKLLKLYPNPAADKMYIYYPETFTGHLTLSDNIGRVLLRKEISQEGIHELNIDRFIPGIYFVNIRGKEFNYYQRLIIN